MSNTINHNKSQTKWDRFREKVYIIIYGINTPAGKAFDVALMVLILLSVIVVMLETVKGVDARFHNYLIILEWVFTILFSIEYILRVISSPKPWKYIFSFYGLIDILSLLPMYFSIFISGSKVLSSLRILRLLRMFRVFKLMEFMQESTKLKVALLQSRAKILVFLYTVMIIAVLIGTLMYFIEGPENGFTSIPISVFYTIVTLTTVGFGDLVPSTSLGQFLSMILMILGYGIIAVPTGIVSVEMAKQVRGQDDSPREVAEDSTVSSEVKEDYSIDLVCDHCNYADHKQDAAYCYHCGHRLST